MDFDLGQSYSQTNKDEDLLNSEPNDNEFSFTLDDTNYISKADTSYIYNFGQVRK